MCSGLFNLEITRTFNHCWIQLVSVKIVCLITLCHVELFVVNVYSLFTYVDLILFIVSFDIFIVVSNCSLPRVNLQSEFALLILFQYFG